MFELSIIVASILLLLILSMLKKPTQSERDLNRIPGPKRLPVIGNLHLLLSKSMPHFIFRQLAAKYGPLLRLQLGGVPFLIVSSVEAAKQVLKTHDVAFANRPTMHAATTITYNCSNIAFAPYGDYWRSLRKICTLELLSSKRVRYFRPIREEENANLAAWIASKEGLPVNLSEIVGLSAFDITSRASVGEETEEKETMAAAIQQGIALGSGLSVADLYPSNKLLPLITGMDFKIRKVFRQTDRVFESIIRRHRAAGQSDERSEDLVDVLLKCQQDDAGVPLTNDNIKAVILDMFLAGTETSSTAVEWVMSEMIRNPRTLKKAQEEVRDVFANKGYIDEQNFEDLKYLKLVVKETLRLHPPVPLLVPRINSEKCEINGYQIPAGTRVMVNAWALGRDCSYWDEAEKFNPERFEGSNIDFKGNNLEFIPFGAGRRMCPGMSFGLANIEFALATLLYHFDWEMPAGEELDMEESFGATAKRKNDLLLIPTLKRPLRSLKSC
ncbi:desmethyl-deoxy-podophyllotoxin synthase-like [Salvia hispanica]|uniref:desmethyl-deoxy-podophyllotoxin synthase-like n=1 Tax=Salvia hispanica TaxID=49212 RepID=UPI0020090819|nr:desmethyl-deoxy-podophyllotoxin synthase-like [Salvia hispanica]